MKRLIVVFLVAYILFLYACGGGGGGNGNSGTVFVVGTWEGMSTSNVTKESSSLTIELNQDGNTLSGSFSIPDSPCFPSGEFNGTIDGSSIELSGSSIGGGFSVSLSVSGDSMTGTYLAVGNDIYCTGTDTGTVTLSR